MGGSNASAGPAQPQLRVGSGAGAPALFTSGREYIVGRHPDCDVVVDDRRASRRHGVLRYGPDGWEFTDPGSGNGSYVDGRRVHRVVVAGGCQILLGDPVDGERLTLAPVAAAAVAPTRVIQRGPISVPPPPGRIDSTPHQGVPGPPPGNWSERPYTSIGLPGGGDRQPSMVMPAPVRTMRIGRALDNDLVLTDLMVSRHHSELRKLPDGRFEIADLESHNGTYVNGRPIERVVLAPGDLVGIGHATFELDAESQELREFIDTGEVSLDVKDLVVRAGEKVLLDKVSFPVGEKTLLAIVGTSGAGKSTLLRALTGTNPADEGTVFYDGRDLYAQYAELRQRIGLVPQDDILHTQLTVRTALRYAARLRFPQDTDKAERDRRVEEVLVDLGLEHRADLRVDKLSGGQRKRVSVAVELLTKPSLLFLDEPTSGLDPGYERELMEKLRELADDGRTVIVVTHSMESLDVCDRLLVLVAGGKVAYYGPPGEALDYFGTKNWAETFRIFNTQTSRNFSGEFTGSDIHRRYGETGQLPEASRQNLRPESRPPKSQGWFSQWGTLSRRYLSVIGSDRKYLGLLLIAPLFLGALVRVMPGELFGEPGTSKDGQTKLLVLFVISGLMGTATAVNELIKERAIYRRERSAGLSVSAYLASKVLVLSLISALQGVLLTGVALGGVELPPEGVAFGPPVVEVGLAVVLSAIASMALGLLISAVIGTAELAMPLLVVVAIIQVVLCGALFPLHGKIGVDQVSWLAPARWALSASANSVDLVTLLSEGAITDPDPGWKATSANYYRNIGFLIAQVVAYSMIALLLLRRLDPAKRKNR